MVVSETKRAGEIIPGVHDDSHGHLLGLGVLFTTLITLVVVPALYLIVDDLFRLMRRRPAADEECGRTAPITV